MSFFKKDKKINSATEKPRKREIGKGEEKKSVIAKINDYLLSLSRVPLKEKLFFVQYFSIMFRAGISLSAIFRTLSEQSKNKYFSQVLNDIAHKTEQGVSLGESFRPYKRIFGDLFINMVEAGESSGNLEKVLDQLYLQIKKKHDLLSKVKGALTYPLVIVFVMIIIGVFMMVFVVPKLTDMLRSFDVELPLTTRIVLGASDFIVNNGLILLLAVLILAIALFKVFRTYKGKYVLHGILLKTPIFSAIIKKINLARFSRTISGLLKTDILIVQTLKITSGVLGNVHYANAVEEMSETIKKGKKINVIVSTYPNLFPPVVCQVISVGEETGKLDEMLVELADFYEEEVDNIMENLPSIIEPLLILLLGIGVGVMAAAILMPMYSLTSTL